jgi:A/G-specific adenine glycosylase
VCTPGGPCYGGRVDEALRRRLLEWQRTSGRTVEVREATEPWPVLVAEVMSQQTQIARVGPAHRAFMARFPTPADLAAAPTRDLLDAWAGLGYNRRALALREAARTIVRDHGGAVPADLAALSALPGLGPYTARAVLAIAFGVPVAPLDVNVDRVIRRFLGLAPGGRARDVQAAADATVDPSEVRRWIWAVMDLAATTCTRRAPRCGQCPLALGCASRDTAGEVAVRGAGATFETTTRWLRGALLRELRAAPVGAWREFDGAVGRHAPEAVEAALRDLESDGFLERDGRRARLPA